MLKKTYIYSALLTSTQKTFSTFSTRARVRSCACVGELYAACVGVFVSVCVCACERACVETEHAFECDRACVSVLV